MPEAVDQPVQYSGFHLRNGGNKPDIVPFPAKAFRPLLKPLPATIVNWTTR